METLGPSRKVLSYVGNVEYTFITNTSRSTLTRIDNACHDPNNESKCYILTLDRAVNQEMHSCK